MRFRAAGVVVSLAVLGMVGCSKADEPLSPSASLGAPTPMAPANNAQLANLAQPVTLSVQNAPGTAATVVTYTFEVATDATFQNLVQIKPGVAEGANGQTTVRLDMLQAAKQYFWHARAAASGATGAFGSSYSFTIGEVISLSAPVPISPLSGANTTDRPAFIVANSARAGAIGVVMYRFEVADNLNFAPALLNVTVAETATQTSVLPSAALPTGRSLFWRASALDTTNNITGPSSAAQSFTPVNPSAASLIAARQGVILWSGVQPPGATGRATMSAGWDVANRVDFLGRPFLSPTLEELRVFDLLDRGMDPNSAIAWMTSNGYPTVAVYYPAVAAIGFPQQYMAFINGAWELVFRIGA